MRSVREPRTDTIGADAGAPPCGVPRTAKTVASTPTVVLSVDPRTLTIRQIGGAAGAWLGATTQELCGRPVADWVACPGERPLTERLRAFANGDDRESRLRLAPRSDVDAEWPATLEWLEGVDNTPQILITLRTTPDHREMVNLTEIPAIGDLVASLAHDFNNLFSVIFGSLTLLQEEGPEVEDFEALIDDAVAAGQEGCAMIEKLVSAVGRQVLRPTRVDAHLLSTRLAALLRRTLPASIELRLRTGTGLPSVNVDPAQFEHTLLQLLVNAREAMPDGGVIAVTLERATGAIDPGRDGPPEHLLITIADTGSGISTDPIERAYMPLVSTRSPRRGRGFGLSIARAFVYRSGGSMSLSSGAAGTTVTLRFPAAD